MLVNLIDRRGVSPVIATVLLIMITVLAVAILTGFILPFVRDGLSKSTECSDVDESFKFDESFGYNCRKLYSEGSENVSFSVSRSNDDSKKINGFSVAFYGNGISKSFQVLNGVPNPEIQMIGQNGLEIPTSGETRSYIFNTTQLGYKKAELKVVLKSGRVCEKVSDSIEITEC